ncbi:MAG: response regulator [Candidatus Brocadiaceae bacterium]|jgi:DNA-binding response OmpR family regulator
MADPKKVLIVDDEPHILRSLGFVVQRAGYEVLEARGGQQALDMIAEHRPHLVFLDIMMPELDGYEVCRRVKASSDLRGTYVIMLTAKGQQDDYEEGVEAGADEYMTKPFSPSRAVERVEAVLGSPE